MNSASGQSKNIQPVKIVMLTAIAVPWTLAVIAQPTINGRLPRRHPHNGNLLAPRLHVKIAPPKQRRDDGAAAEADLRQGRVFGVYICIRRITRAKVDVGDAAVGLTPAQLDDMDGGVIEGEGGTELSPAKLRGETVDVHNFQRSITFT